VQAIEDACLRPSKRKDGYTPQVLAINAIDFLFKNADGYLAALDIDPTMFRKNLVNSMYGGGTFLFDNKIDGIQQKSFRFNYQHYYNNGERAVYNLGAEDYEKFA
jgi:hypothetical protein